MKLMVGNEDLATRIRSRIGEGKLILYKYGPGSGGDRLLLEFFQYTPSGYNPLFLSTHMSEKELKEVFNDMEMDNAPSITSFLHMMDGVISDTEKKDRFIKEGIMVTDLLEISSHSDEAARPRGPGQMMLASLSSAATRQVLPFWLVLDSLTDLNEYTDMKELMHRLAILKRSIREKGGIAIMACPLGNELIKDKETTFFDAVIEVRADRKGDVWTRKLTIQNIKGKGDLPEEWEINVIKDIPTAISME